MRDKLTINLNYNYEGDYKIKQCDRLSFELKPVSTSESYILFSYASSHVTQLVDEGVKVAGLNASNRKSLEIVFEPVKTSFKASIEMPYTSNSDNLYKYFIDHPQAEKLEIKYQLYINDSPTDKTVTYCFFRKDIGPSSTRFAKTSGLYKQIGEFGAGQMLFNIKVGTTLRHCNEFVIYDTPDVNLAFDGDIDVYSADTFGKTNHWITNSSHYKEDNPNIPEEELMEVFIEDIYFLTNKSDTANTPAMARYIPDNDYTFDRTDIGTGEKPLHAADSVIRPRDIILKKPMGQSLTAQEQALIDSKGGLNKKVGKGFKIRIKNFKSKFAKGGFFTLIYRLEIINSSSVFDSKGMPIYYNQASYYGQEIPNCKPGDVDCKPISSEKSTTPERTTGKVSDGSISVEVDKFSEAEFTKVAATKDGGLQVDNPLQGAKFTIYKIDNGLKVVAVNKNKILLENLITNEQGKLCDSNGRIIDLKLERGNYVFEETEAPVGYQLPLESTIFIVGLIKNEFYLGNKKLDEKITKFVEQGTDNYLKPNVVATDFAEKEDTIQIDGKTYKLVNTVTVDNVRTYEYLLQAKPINPDNPEVDADDSAVTDKSQEVIETGDIFSPIMIGVLGIAAVALHFGAIRIRSTK